MFSDVRSVIFTEESVFVCLLVRVCVCVAPGGFVMPPPPPDVAAVHTPSA